MRQFALLLVTRFVTAGVVAVLGSMVASLYYVDIAGISQPEEVMEHRPDAPGSPYAALAAHPECWASGEPRGVLVGALIRRTPNGPFIYVSSVEHKHGDLFIRALEQAIGGKERGIDTVLAFCTHPG